MRLYLPDSMLNKGNQIPFYVFIFILFSLYGLVIYSALFNQGLYRRLLEDGGGVELLAIIFTVIAAILFGISYFRHSQPKSIPFLLLAVVVPFAINGVVYRIVEFFFLGITLLIFILPRLHRALLKLKLPIPSPATAFLVLLNYLLFTYCFKGFVSLHGYLGYGEINYGEIFETGFRLIVLYFALECFTRGLTWVKDEEIVW